MTSASELFYTRRSRVGRAAASSATLGPEGFDSSPNRSCYHNNNRRHLHPHHDLYHYQTHSLNHAHDHGVRHRHDSHASGSVSAGRFPSLSERESVLFSLHGNSSRREDLNGPGTSGRFINRRGLIQNDRLPGSVLLARERLVQRLRGMALSANRRSGRTTSINYNIEHTGRNLRLTNSDDFPTDSQTRVNDLNLHREQLPSMQEERKKKPPGLTQDALGCLKVEFFSCRGNHTEGASPLSSDCSICLESFREKEKLIRLPCEHRFHSACLDPWLRTCGDCPYCRRTIEQVESPEKQKLVTELFF